MKKKGSEEIFSIWNFIIWIFVAICFLVAISMFNSKRADVRQIEARLLVDCLVDCAIGEKLNPVFLKKNTDIASECNIIDTGKIFGGVFVYVKDAESKSHEYPGYSLVSESVIGKRYYSQFCGIEGRGGPVCIKEIFKLNDYLVEVIAASDTEQ